MSNCASMCPINSTNVVTNDISICLMDLLPSANRPCMTRKEFHFFTNPAAYGAAKSDTTKLTLARHRGWKHCIQNIAIFPSSFSGRRPRTDLQDKEADVGDILTVLTKRLFSSKISSGSRMKENTDAVVRFGESESAKGSALANMSNFGSQLYCGKAFETPPDVELDVVM